MRIYKFNMPHWWIFAFLWIGLSALFVLVYPPTSSDTLTRYAPMAEAFARGDWCQAFHPRFGVLFPSLAGAFAWMLPVNGIQAAQIASTLLWVLAAAMAWMVANDLFDRGTAWMAAFLVMLSPELSNYAMDGLREGGKAFAILASASVFLNIRSSCWWGAARVFVLLTLRADSIALGLVMLAAYTIYAVAKRQYTLMLPSYLLGTAGLFLMCFMTRAYVGVWAPCVQMVNVIWGMM